MKMRQVRVITDGDLVYVTSFTDTWPLPLALDEVVARIIPKAGHRRDGSPLPATLHLSPAAYDEAETYLNNGPWEPSADAVKLWHPRPVPRPGLFWKAVPIVRDEEAPFIDVRAEQS